MSPTVRSDDIVTSAGSPTVTVPFAPVVSDTLISSAVPEKVTLPPPPPEPPGVNVTTAVFAAPADVGNVYVVLVSSAAGNVIVFKLKR